MQFWLIQPGTDLFVPVPGRIQYRSGVYVEPNLFEVISVSGAVQFSPVQSRLQAETDQACIRSVRPDQEFLLFTFHRLGSHVRQPHARQTHPGPKIAYLDIRYDQKLVTTVPNTGRSPPPFLAT